MLKKFRKYLDMLNPLKLDFVSGILTAVLFSSFIYLEHNGITFKLLNTIFGIASLALFLYMPKRAVLIAGFLLLRWIE